MPPSGLLPDLAESPWSKEVWPGVRDRSGALRRHPYPELLAGGGPVLLIVITFNAADHKNAKCVYSL